MDSAKLPSSSTGCKEWCVSTNTTVISDQVKKNNTDKSKYTMLSPPTSSCAVQNNLAIWAHSKPLSSLCSVPAAKVAALCPDCPSHINMDHAEVQKTIALSLEKFNMESGLAKHFALLKVNRATSGVSVPHVQNSIVCTLPPIAMQRIW